MPDVNDIDDRWTMVGDLVERCGTAEEKLAWALCRGDFAELRVKMAEVGRVAVLQRTVTRECLKDIAVVLGRKVNG